MKKSDDIRRRTWRMLAKNLIVLVALAVAAAVGVMSWFTNNSQSKADGISAQAHVEDGLEFYIMPPSYQTSEQGYNAINTRLAANAAWNENNSNQDGFVPKRSTWHTSSDGEVSFDFSTEEFNFMKSLFLCEVTGDGSNFMVPKLLQYDNIAYVDENQDFDPAKANDEYMSFDIYFRSEIDQARDISLLSDSSITANSSYSTATIQNFSKSADAESRKDAAIGAVRVSVLNMEAGSSCQALWIPGPYVYYDGLNDTLYTGLSSSSYDNKGSVYYNSLKQPSAGIDLRSGEGTDDHAFYASKNSRQLYDSSNPPDSLPMFVGSQLGSNQTVVTMQNQSGNYFYGRIRVNLWIEGEDAEARLSFVGGKFEMKLHFEMNNTSN